MELTLNPKPYVTRAIGDKNPETHPFGGFGVPAFRVMPQIVSISEN